MDEPEPKARSIEKVRTAEFDRIGIVKTECAMNVEGVENGWQMNNMNASLMDNTDNYSERGDETFIELTGGREVCPSTPSLDKESLEISSSSEQSEHGALSGSQTPTENIFDPFAACPEELAFAPKKKMLRGTQIPLRRQLNFYDWDASTETEMINVPGDAAEEEHLLQYFFQSFLELIVSSQIREVSAGKLPDNDNQLECLKTPTSLPFLTGIAETCPPAPMKQLTEPRKLPLGVCRKLEFG